jgi:hypothetical protein
VVDLHSFDNRLRSLFNIDYNRLPEMSESQWSNFRDNPVHFWITCDDSMRDAIWREVQHRCIKHDKPSPE